MPPSSPHGKRSIRTPHPLASLLIERLRLRPHHARVLDFAAGSGRNATALREAGFDVVEIGDAAAERDQPPSGAGDGFDGIVSSHGLLHGNAAQVARRIDALATMLGPGGLLAATFGSTKDARFGRGAKLDASTFAPLEGDERGVAHAFFTQTELRDLLRPSFELELCEERAVDEIAGKWAHEQRPLEGAVHWFVLARRR